MCFEGMTKKLRPKIVVVCGGPSVEAEVSRSSGREVAEALKQTFEDVDVVELDWDIARSLAEKTPDVVFPVLHGPPGEDGTFQGFLEILGLPYVGSGVFASAAAMDKVAAKKIFRDLGLPLAKDSVVRRRNGVAAALEAVRFLGPRVVVKPARQGSGLGVTIVKSESGLEPAIGRAFELDEYVLVEEFVEGKEVTAGVLERNGIEALPVCEIRTPPGTWYDYTHRYTAGLSEHLIPAPLPEDQYRRVQELACQAHEGLQCRDLSRIDFVVPDRGEPIVLEVNTLPGMTATSLYPDEARAAGISFPELVAHLVERAFQRRT